MKKALSILTYSILLLPLMAWAQPEPTNHVTGFTATATSPTAISLSWTDAVPGSNAPEFYLILGRKLPGGVFATVPDQDTEVPADADWSDDNFAAIVAYGDPDALNVTGLDPESEYEFAIYPYQRTGGSGGSSDYKETGAPTASDFTFSTAPSGHSTTFTATLDGNTTIDLAFDAANTLTDADGYVIYRRPGSSATLTGLNDGTAAPGTLGGTTTLVYTTNNSETTYSDTGLDGGVTYHYVLVPFNYNGADDDTYNYLTDGSEPRANATTVLVITMAQISGGGSNIAVSPLNSGATDQAILGFSITTNGPTTFNAINIDVSTTPVGKFTNPRLFKSANASFGGDISIRTGALSGSQINYAASINDNLTAGTTNYFVVADVAASVNGATPSIQPSFSESDVTFTSGSTAAITVTGIDYSFADVSPPIIVSETPADNATNVPVGLNTLTITFNEDVVYDGDNADADEMIRIRDIDNTTFIDTIEVANVSVAGNVVTITFSAALDPDTDYAIRIGSSVFRDANNNYFPGITNNSDWNFETEPPPSISGYSADPTCMGETITINGTGFGGTTPTVTVNGINVVPIGSTATTITIVVPTTTSGNATVVVTNTGNGLNDSDNTLTLKEAVAANLPLSTDPATPVVSQNYSIVVSNSQPTVNYRVRELPAGFAGGTTPGNGGDLSLGNFNKGAPGTFQYEVQAQSTGCTTRTYGPLAVVIASLLADAGPDKTICAGDTISIGGNPTASGGTGFHQISWTAIDSDPSLSGQNAFSNPRVAPSATTRYRVVVDDSSPATPSVDTVVITVNQPTPQNLLEIQLNPTKPNDIYQKDDEPVQLNYTLNGIPGGFAGNTRFEGPGVNSTSNPKYFYPNAGNVGNNEIVLFFENNQQCITTDTVIVFVRDNNVFLTGLDPQYCEGDIDNNLTIQTPVTYLPFKFDFGIFGGVFYIPGIRYIYQPPNVRLRNTDNGTLITAPGAFTVSGAGSRDVDLNTELTGAGSRAFEIKYLIQRLAYNDLDPANPIVTDTSSQFIQIPFFVIPKPVITNRIESSYCVDQTPFILNVSPVGGSFTINGNPGGATFDPATTGYPDNVPISYTYQDPETTCENTINHVITINRLPGLDIDFENGCEDEPIAFTPVFDNPNGINFRYDLDVGSSRVFKVDNNTPQTFFNSYSVPSNYEIVLTVTTAAGCDTEVDETLIIGETPDVSLNWSNVCDGDQTRFVLASNFFDTKLNDLDSVLWFFGDTDELKVKSPAFSDSVTSHLYSQTGNYIGVVGLKTDLGCAQYDTVSVYKVKKQLVNQASEYLENFDTTFVAQGWLTGGENSSWAWGIPSDSLINDDSGGGGAAWVTDLGGVYNTNEDSWVHSPCFDLTEIKRPYLQFDFRSLTRALADGAVLQYNYQNTTDDETDWIRVDAPNDTENWYNGSGIASNPGNQSVLQRGWTGLIDTTAWRTTVIALDDVIQSIPANRRDRVRFRFAFSSLAQQSTIQPQFEGFAFDNFEIGERDRVVLIEQFTNNGSINNGPAEPNRASNTALNTFINSGNGEAVKLEYHVGFPGPNMDPLYLNNEQDMNARAAFYGVVSTPTTFVNANTGNLASIFQNETLRAAQVTIDTIFTTNTPPDQLNVTVRFTANRPLPANTRLHIAAIETLIDTTAAHGTNGETSYQYVVRKLIPNALGTVFSQPIPRDSSRTVNVSWTPKAYRLNRLGIIAFVQNGKEIYQARMDTTLQYIPPANLITGIEDPAFAEKILIYPNPANREVNVVLPERTLTPIALNLMDAHGRTVHTNGFATGEQQKTIDTNELASGLYILQFNTQQGVVRKKVMVVHEK